MKILIIDNYDSFTYNLVHLVQNIIKENIDVKRNDEFELEELIKYNKIILSPGPGIPDEAGKLKEEIKKYAPIKNIFGVCLGWQAIAEVCGGSLINLNDVYHGLATNIIIKDKKEKIFRSLPGNIMGGRYHSWIVDKSNLPDCFKITAEDDTGKIMALSHKEYDVKGVQFHPESILTDQGIRIMANWLLENEIFSINLPSEGNSDFEVNKLSSKLLFC